MKNRETTNCHACSDAVNPEDLTEIAGDAICPTCVQACEDHYSMDDDHGDTAYGDDSWVDYCDGEAELAHWDDDPNPYHGNYSEM